MMGSSSAFMFERVLNKFNYTHNVISLCVHHIELLSLSRNKLYFSVKWLKFSFAIQKKFNFLEDLL